MPSYNPISKYILFIVSLFAFIQTNADIGTHNILEQYVKKDDGAFSYQEISTISRPGLNAYIYKLTSQNWRSASEVNRTLWEHRLTVVVPDNLTNNKAILFTFGGENTSDYLTPDPTRLELLGTFARLTGSVAIEVCQVPNQPLVFSDEPDIGRTEDDLVAYSWDTAMGSNDYTWTAYLPMTKSVIKAMDATQLIARDLDLPLQPNYFVVVGFSKRGAIAWLSAAIDDRVIAISPGVYDTLNFIPTFENLRKAYGDLPEPLKDYDDRNVLDRFHVREGLQLLDVVDPYTYRHEVSVPKFIINASGDQFFPPNSSHFYLDGLYGESLLRYLPNTDHGGSNGGYESAILGLLAWYQRIADEIPRPTLNWRLSQTNDLSVSVSEPMATAMLWSAHNSNAKDFRLQTYGPNWHAVPIPIAPDGSIDLPLQTPEIGWSGYFVEVTFPGVSGVPEKYTTPVIILPDSNPFSLEQARLTPKPKSTWLEVLADIIAGNSETSKIEDSFPIRSIGDETVSTIKDAHALLLLNHANGKIRAQQECLVTRLNIKDGQIDWYSRPRNGESLFLWRWWNYADLFYRARIYSVTEFICENLNS